MGEPGSFQRPGGRALHAVTKIKFRQRLLTVSLGLVSATSMYAATRVPVANPLDGAAQEATRSTPPTRSSSQNPAGTDPIALPKTSLSAAEQSALKHPQVTYEDGQLTIVAEDVPLSEVLAAVRQATGADIDIRGGAATQHIWVRSGPGPARSILRELLDGTELDYVIQASETDLDGVKSVMLTPRSKGSEVGGPENPLVRSANRGTQPAASVPVDVPVADSLTPDEKVAANDSGPAEPAPDSTRARSAARNVQPASLSLGSVSHGPSSGSTDQMIQQLQNMYQQRRQIQIQQNQNPPVTD